MPKTTAAVDLAEDAFYDRAVDDGTLRAELGHDSDDERIHRGRAADLFDQENRPQASAFPLLSFFGVTGPEIGGGYGRVQIQCDIGVWRWGEDGGQEKLKAIDAALLGLFHEQAWTYDGRRFFCPRTSWRRGDDPELLHRVREFAVHVGG